MVPTREKSLYPAARSGQFARRDDTPAWKCCSRAGWGPQVLLPRQLGPQVLLTRQLGTQSAVTARSDLGYSSVSLDSSLALAPPPLPPKPGGCSDRPPEGLERRNRAPNALPDPEGLPGCSPTRSPSRAPRLAGAAGPDPKPAGRPPRAPGTPSGSATPVSPSTCGASGPIRSWSPPSCGPSACGQPPDGPAACGLPVCGRLAGPAVPTGRPPPFPFFLPLALCPVLLAPGIIGMPGIGGIPFMPPPIIWRIIFWPSRNRTTSELTSPTVTPAPFAIRRRRGPLRSFGFLRSAGVIELTIAAARSRSESLTWLSISRFWPAPGSIPSRLPIGPSLRTIASCSMKSSSVKPSAEVSFP